MFFSVTRCCTCFNVCDYTLNCMKQHVSVISLNHKWDGHLFFFLHFPTIFSVLFPKLHGLSFSYLWVAFTAPLLWPTSWRALSLHKLISKGNPTCVFVVWKTGPQENAHCSPLLTDIRTRSNIDSGFITREPGFDLVNGKHASEIVFLLSRKVSGSSVEVPLFQWRIVRRAPHSLWLFSPLTYLNKNTPSSLTWLPSSQSPPAIQRCSCSAAPCWCVVRLCFCFPGLPVPLDSPCALSFSYSINLLIRFKQFAN